MDTDIAQLTHRDAGFERTVADLLFNKLPLGRAPDMVVTPRTEAEVGEIVRSARLSGHKVAVRSGGHSWIGASVRESGVLIDMSAFDRVEIDAASLTARVGPAVRSGTLAKALAAEGLAYPSGHCGTPAFGGYMLGGGLGLNWGRWKPACYSLQGVRVVTADAKLIVASESNRGELLWLARGSGPAFPGVVTEFTVNLQPRPADTRVSSWLFALDDLPAVSRWVTDVSRTLPSNVEVATAVLGPERPELRPGEGFPDRVVTVTAIVFAEDAQEAREAVAPMAAGSVIPPLAHSDLEPVPFELVPEAFDAEFPEDHCYLADTFWTDLHLEAALTPLQDAFARAPSGKSVVIALMPGHGAKMGLAMDEGAYSMDERTLVMPYAVWEDPASEPDHRAWMSEITQILEPISAGHFLSEADLDAHPGRLARCFTPSNWERLLELRAKWDPERVFHDITARSGDR